MFPARIISEGIRAKGTPDKILKFINGMDWIYNQLDMEEYCKKFMEVCNKIGGSCIPASKTQLCIYRNFVSGQINHKSCT